MTLPLLLSIPHGSRHIPSELTERMAVRAHDVFEDGDPFTDLIYDLTPHVQRVISANVARAVVDLNRSPDDLPPSNPDGVIKSQTCLGVPVWSQEGWRDQELVRHLLADYHTPYHLSLQRAATAPGLRLGVDCHSMAAHPPPISPAKDPRPTFCISNANGQTCDNSLLELLARSLADAFEIDDAEIGLNVPFAGGYITRRHGNRPIPWIQLEMNRNLYLVEPWYDPATTTIQPGRIAQLQERLLQALEGILADVK